MADVSRDYATRQRRDGDGYPDCSKCWGNGIIADPFGPPPSTIPCPECGGSQRGPYDHIISDDVRLGAVLAGLTLACRSARDAVKQASPPARQRQSLDGDEHDGHWLTRKQVLEASRAASELDRILREIQARAASLSGRSDPS